MGQQARDPKKTPDPSRLAAAKFSLALEGGGMCLSVSTDWVKPTHLREGNLLSLKEI